MPNNSVKLTQNNIEYSRHVPIHELKKAGKNFAMPSGEARRALKITEHVGPDTAPGAFKVLWADKTFSWVPPELILDPEFVNSYFLKRNAKAKIATASLPSSSS